MVTDPVSAPAGWYPDGDSGGTRYWDGARWTSDVRPPAPAIVVNVTVSKAGPATTRRPGWYDDGSGRTRWWDGQRWTDPVHVARTAPARSSHGWWALSPLYSFGLVAFVPALHAAVKLRRRDLWYWAGGLIGGNALIFALMSGPSNADGSSTTAESVGGVLCIVLAVLGTVHAYRMRDEVFAPSGVGRSTASLELDPAVMSSRAALKRRAESVALSVKHPSLARDLMIGRPDLVRRYDDGGLIDVNHVPEAVLVSHLGFSHEQARSVIEARDRIGGFVSVAELCSLGGVAPQALDRIRDRVVTL